MPQNVKSAQADATVSSRLRAKDLVRKRTLSALNEQNDQGHGSGVCSGAIGMYTGLVGSFWPESCTCFIIVRSTHSGTDSHIVDTHVDVSPPLVAAQPAQHEEPEKLPTASLTHPPVPQRLSHTVQHVNKFGVRTRATRHARDRARLGVQFGGQAAKVATMYRVGVRELGLGRLGDATAAYLTMAGANASGPTTSTVHVARAWGPRFQHQLHLQMVQIKHLEVATSVRALHLMRSL